MHNSVKSNLKSFLKQFEGKVNHMYLDKKGLVTIGIGYLIDPVDEAVKLEFRQKGGGTVGSGAVRAEWEKVKARTDLKDKGGSAFAAITSLELSDRGIDQMVDVHAAAVEKYYKTNATASKYYGKFDSFSADAQMALIGIAWGIVPIPQFGWHKFPEACKREDWIEASNECSIKDAPEGRNRAHKVMFENAASVKHNKSDIKVLHWPKQLMKQAEIKGRP